MRIALSVATALLLAAMTTQAGAQADPHHPEGTEAATAETTTGPATGCPAQETVGGMPRPEIGSSSPMEMMRMMQMMQQMQMVLVQQLIQQMQRDSEQQSEAVQ